MFIDAAPCAAAAARRAQGSGPPQGQRALRHGVGFAVLDGSPKTQHPPVRGRAKNSVPPRWPRLRQKSNCGSGGRGGASTQCASREERRWNDG